MEQDIRDILHSKGVYIYDAIDIIKEFYGEDFVDDSYIYKITKERAENLDYSDIQYHFEGHNVIFIYFPQITVTNEFNKSMVINDSYIKIEISTDGRMSDYFTMTRASFTKAQLHSLYVHSHAEPFCISRVFSTMCFGQGPFNIFMQNIVDCEYSEERWSLFCLYLKQYLEVESVEGTPYIRLEGVNANSRPYELEAKMKTSSRYCNYLNVRTSDGEPKDISHNKIIRYIADNNVLSYNYGRNHYGIACSINEFAVKVSNAVLKFYEENGFRRNTNDFVEVSYKDGSFYEINNASTNIPAGYENRHLLTFKGQDIRLKIIDKDAQDVAINKVMLLTPAFLANLYYSIIYFINKYYGTKDKITGQASYL